MAKTRSSLRNGTAKKKRKSNITQGLSVDHTVRKPSDEPLLERIVRINQTNRRKQVGLSQKALGIHIGVSQPHIAALEADWKMQSPNLVMLEKLAGALNCTAADLVTPGRFS